MNKLNRLIKQRSVNFKRNFISVVFIVLIITVCILHAVDARYNINFFPINGTFQNYNVVRRFLSGQIPYRDFTVYLGLGHLYFGSVFTFLFGNNYASSLVAFYFLTILSLCILSIIIGKAVFRGRSKNIYAFTLLLLITLMIRPLIYTNAVGILQEFVDALNSSLSPGNSARFIRGFAPTFFVLLIELGFYLCKKIEIEKKLPKLKTSYIFIGGYSILSSFAFVWSNDYGIASWICSLIMLMIITFSRTKNLLKVMKAFVSQIIISMFMIFILIEILTLGNINSWISTTFGTGGYQTWYYGVNEEYRSFYIYDVDFSFIMLIQAFIIIYYIYKLYKNKGTLEACKRYGILAFLNMTSFAAVNEYKLLSVGASREVALSILFLTICYETISFGYFLINHKDIWKKVLLAVSFICGVAFSISQLKEEIISFNTDYRGEYEPGLGGYLTKLNEDIDNAEEFIGNQKVFSTYASALETVTNQFQPSGTDYIIHVLGDSAREKYLKSFKEDDFKYVTTIKEDYTGWEAWIKSANWFFYRELLKDYHPVYANSYQLFWEKNENSYVASANEEPKVNIAQVDNNKVIISVETDKSISGIADVLIKYKGQKKDTLRSKLILNKMVYIRNSRDFELTESQYDGYCIPSEGEQYIPVTVANGYGEVVLTSLPEKSTTLDVDSASCNQILTASYDRLDISESVYLDDLCKIEVKNNKINQLILENGSSLEIADRTIQIKDIDSSDTENIVITLDTKNIELLKKLLKVNNVCIVNKN